MENIRYEVWLQNQDKFDTQRPDMNFIDPMFSVLGLGFASPDMNFIDPNFFCIRTIVHCVTNSIWYHSFL